MLCFSSLGKRRIIDLINLKRVFLLSYLKSNSDFFKYPFLDNFTAKLGIADTPAVADAIQPVAVIAFTSTIKTIQPVAVERRKYKILSI